MDKVGIAKYAAAARTELMSLVEERLPSVKTLAGNSPEAAARQLFVRFITLQFLKINGYLSPGARVAERKGEDILAELMPFVFNPLSVPVRKLACEHVFGAEGLERKLEGYLPGSRWVGQVQIIGWLYQYYMADQRAAVYRALRRGSKLSGRNLAIATQIFTPGWIVRFLLDNSLGRYLLETDAFDGLEKELAYYIQPLDPEQVCRSNRESLDLRQVKILDPACGAGHMLLYAFDILYGAYQLAGYPQERIPFHILTGNLYGLDIDPQAVQLARLALTMKAREKDPKILEKVAGLNVFCVTGELGSIRHSPAKDHNLGPVGRGQESVLSTDYEVVVTNPPYVSRRHMSPTLKQYLDDHYPEVKSDLFAVFIKRCLQFACPGGYVGMMTPFVWLFISSYQKLREYLIREKSINSLVQLEYSAFKDATVPLCVFTLRNGQSTSPGVFISLTEFAGPDNQGPRALAAVRNPGANYRYSVRINEFSRIPGSPIAYWASDKIRAIYERATPLRQVAKPRQGLATTDNERFVRKWYEVDFAEIGFGCQSREQARESGLRWFPYNKGGKFRKWYGNLEHVVNWEDDGAQIKRQVVRRYPYLGGNYSWVVKNARYYFRSGITWTFVSSGKFAARYSPPGLIFDVAGSCAFPDRADLLYLLALLNSRPAMEFLKIQNPTLNFQVGDLSSLPVLWPRQGVRSRIKLLAGECIKIARADWDSFETSWRFRRHPLLTDRGGEGTIASAFARWSRHKDEQLQRLRRCEEELNGSFIALYGLEDELTAGVSTGDLPIRRADRGRDVKSFISYAVGCMMGRYCLGRDGVVCAGGELLWEDYPNFTPVPFGIVPVSQEPGGPEDVIFKLEQFLIAAFGTKTLEENLNYTAASLNPQNGETSRTTIRRYFLTGFFSDHVKTYKKRPIYWLFSSGRHRAFSALVYIHRFRPNTLTKLRSKYLSEVRCQLEQAIGASTSEAGKKEEIQRDGRYRAQLRELDRYEGKLRQFAARAEGLELNAGVKANYRNLSPLLVKM